MTTRLWALGSNSSGQLGVGHYEDVDIPTPCNFIHAQSLYGTTSSAKAHLEQSDALRSPVRKIVAGGNHTIVLCENGAVYAAGNGEALGECVELASHPSVSDELSSQDLTPCFKRVMWWEESQLLDTFLDVSATWTASFFVIAPQTQGGYVVRRGRIYVCGKGEKGELGLGKYIVETAKPRQVAEFGPKDYPGNTSTDLERVPLIPGLLAGIWSSVAYTLTCSTDDIHIFGWGSCRKGQLGNSTKAEKELWKPRRVTDEDIKQDTEIDRISMAAVGKDFALYGGTHGKREDMVRKWRLLGGNSVLKSDGDDVKSFLADLSIPGPSAEMVWPRTGLYASWSNVYILESRANKVKALGRNDHGQLPPKQLPGVWTMAAGSEHCVGLTPEGRVVTWGWGEHGNCGRRSDETGQGWSVLSLPTERAAGVGAGCATTFIWTDEK